MSIAPYECLDLKRDRGAFNHLVGAGAGNFTILSTSEPFAAFMAPEKDGCEFEEYIVCVPGSLLRARVPCVDEYHCPNTNWQNLFIVINLMRWDCDGLIGYGDNQEGFWTSYLNGETFLVGP